MKKPDKEMDDELRPEYDLKSLCVRKVGPMRSGFGANCVQLTPDVVAVFPSADAINEDRANPTNETASP